MTASCLPKPFISHINLSNRALGRVPKWKTPNLLASLAATDVMWLIGSLPVKDLTIENFLLSQSASGHLKNGSLANIGCVCKWPLGGGGCLLPLWLSVPWPGEVLLPPQQPVCLSSFYEFWIQVPTSFSLLSYMLPFWLPSFPFCECYASSLQSLYWYRGLDGVSHPKFAWADLGPACQSYQSIARCQSPTRTGVFL